MRVACVTSDAELAAFLGQNVTMAGHRPMFWAGGIQIRREVWSDTPDAFLIGWALHDASGCDVVRWIRNELQLSVPVILIGNGAPDEDSVLAFAEGADDFIVAPVSGDEFMARLRARLRQASWFACTTCLTYGQYTMYVANRVVTYRDDPVPLTAREFDLLEVFFLNPGRVLDREQLSRAVWKRSAVTVNRTIDTHLSRLRSKLYFSDSSGFELIAIYGRGYTLKVNSCMPGADTKLKVHHAVEILTRYA